MLQSTKHECYKGFFQALYHTNVFVFQIELRPKDSYHAEDKKKSAGGLQSAVSPPVGLGQNPSGGPRGKALGRSAYMGFEKSLILA